MKIQIFCLQKYLAEDALKDIINPDKPEKIIRCISEKATVFAVSATADIDTVIGNFNLNYLHEKLGEKYHPADKNMYERVRNEM